ncbi:sensor histidine kinase [Amycolatopsis taiwanensis]|uniref:sensor histidine kinase n=1 Tax=Amycolatopsis taiwanensis TaxID=342230 RepID=UPI001FDF0C02|nr:histidine kinase [Amycolatopsis taiwanensis]
MRIDSERLLAAWRWLGLEGTVLLAALLGDLLIVLPAAFDNVGPKGRDLLLLPGIFAICGCALWARKRPAEAAFAASGVLVASTMLISVTDASAYSALLSNLSLSETVAGLELAFFCVSRSSVPVAFFAVSSLVVTSLFAVVRRPHGGYLGRDLVPTLLLGLVLLVAVIVTGMRFRKHGEPRKPTGLAGLLRDQWPLTGALCLPLFLDLYRLLTIGVRAFPLALCAVAAAATAVLTTRHPLRAGLGLAGVILASGPAAVFAGRHLSFASQPLLLIEIVAGLVAVVHLVRHVAVVRSWPVIAVLSAAVGVTSAIDELADGGSLGSLRTLFAAGLLLLGMAVAIGLYLRARDSERARVVEAAVTEAQTSERMALARELHDVVAHHVTGIVVQAQAAKLTGAQNPALALEALDRIEEAGTGALTAMRRLVRSMRSHAEDTQQATTDLAADLRRLVEDGHHGVRTEVALRLPGGVPQEVGRSALRLVQESLTNVGKHATGVTCVWVLAEVVGGELHLKVQNDGKPGGPPPGEGQGSWRSGGYGLVGMRERVELLHGRLVAGPVPGGWLVEAWLPLEASTVE